MKLLWIYATVFLFYSIYFKFCPTYQTNEVKCSLHVQMRISGC